MGRLMPGRVRQEGIDLYETGNLVVKGIEDGRLILEIAGETFVYSLEDGELGCSCALFENRGYCPHLAATEYFIKNDSAGQEAIDSLKEDGVLQQEIVRRTYLGERFLEEIIHPNPHQEIKFQLSVEGQLLLFDRQIDWTIKIRRLPEGRDYVVRDIGAFLRSVKKAGQYQIGNRYYEAVPFEQFDEASQELILFLWRLLPEKWGLHSEVLVNFGRHIRLPLALFEEGLALFQRLVAFGFSYDGVDYQELRVYPLTAEEGLYEIEVRATDQLIELEIADHPMRELYHGQYLLRENRVYSLNRQQERLIRVLSDLLTMEQGTVMRRLEFDFQDQARLALALLDFQQIGRVKAPPRFQIRPFEAHFAFSMGESQEILLAVSLEVAGRRIQSQMALASLPFSLDIRQVDALWQLLEEAGFKRDWQTSRPPLLQQEGYAFFNQTLPMFEQFGQVELSPELAAVYTKARPHISIEEKGSLLDISFSFEGIAEAEIGEALAALLKEETHYTSQTGRIFVFDEETKRISQTLRQLRAKHGKAGHLSVGRFASHQLAEAWADEDGIHFSKEFQSLAHDLAHPEGFPLPPVAVHATLRTYQQLGVRWLSMLDKYGFGGILADDMGLGKTLQTIAFLSSQLDETSRVLILAPSSLIYNWQEECQQFAPQLDVAVAYGNKDKRDTLIAEDHQIVVTSYASFRQDIAHYQGRHYDYLILDEAQVMKNAQTKIAQLLREFEVGNCFALSGTPIENHLTELWSIFQIVLPGLLPPKLEFAKLSAQEVARLIRPFVLRRKKEDVLVELPDLIEINALNELTDDQKAIYLAQLRQMQDTIAQSSDAEINRRKIEILSGITRLRQICDTPSLFMPNYKGKSGKLESLRELLLQLKEGNHRVLIFSQFRTMLEVIETELEELGMSSYKLTGSTPAKERQEMTQAFNAGSRDAFLISLKAGGVGLNLTGADTVILVDLWWNPAVEAQAISRAHRMGQTEKVECYRLITRGTIEEKILALQEGKKNLVTTVLDGHEERASMTVEDIKAILGIS